MEKWILTLLSPQVVTNAVLAFVTKEGRKKCQNDIYYDFTSKLKLKKYPFCLAKTYKILNSIVPGVVKSVKTAFLRRPIFDKMS